MSLQDRHLAFSSLASTLASRLPLVLRRSLAVLVSGAIGAAAFGYGTIPATEAASSGLRVVSGQGYSFELPIAWRYWRRETGANWAKEFWRDPGIPWSAMTVMSDGCTCCLSDPTTNTLDLESALGPIVVGTHQISPLRLAFHSTIDPDPLPDNGLVIAVPPVQRGCLRNGWWKIDLWLAASDRALATTILNSVKVP
jgi:hypothetical protein